MEGLRARWGTGCGGGSNSWDCATYRSWSLWYVPLFVAVPKIANVDADHHPQLLIIERLPDRRPQYAPLSSRAPRRLYPYISAKRTNERGVQSAELPDNELYSESYQCNPVCLHSPWREDGF
jgi:hypothetical protein